MPINLLADMLTVPHHYERMVDYLMALNPACHTRAWATDAIDKCIRGALNYGDTSTGMCAGYRNPSGKVRLFIEPLRDMSPAQTGIFVANGTEFKAVKGAFYPKASWKQTPVAYPLDPDSDLISEDRPV